MLFLKAKLSLLPSHYLLPVLRAERFALFWFNFCGNFLSQLNNAGDAALSDDLLRKRQPDVSGLKLFWKYVQNKRRRLWIF